MVEREIQAKQNKNSRRNRLRKVAVGMHHMKDPEARTCIPEHPVAVGEQNAAKQSGAVAAVDQDDEKWSKRNPADEVEAERGETDNLQNRGE